MKNKHCGAGREAGEPVPSVALQAKSCLSSRKRSAAISPAQPHAARPMPSVFPVSRDVPDGWDGVSSRAGESTARQGAAYTLHKKKVS